MSAYSETVNVIMKSRVRESRTHGSVRGWHREVPVYSTIAKLIELGGVTPKVTQMVEFEQHYFPILVADFKMLEFEPEFYRQNKFKVRLIIFNGSEDTEAIESEENLASFFMERSEVYHFKGGHFYLFSEENEICKLITELKELKEL